MVRMMSSPAVTPVVGVIVSVVALVLFAVAVPISPIYVIVAALASIVGIPTALSSMLKITKNENKRVLSWLFTILSFLNLNNSYG
jgi:uncharacterized membrane protein YccF (DUF307 family)